MCSSISSRALVISSTLVAGIALTQPVAQASTWIDTEAVAVQVNSTLSTYGIAVDTNIAADFDAAANAHIASALGLPETEATAEYGSENNNDVATPQLPNYQIRTDLAAQIMAATPGQVVHRAPGSWFNAPDVPAESKAVEAEGKSLYGPGTPIYLGGDAMCTLAVAGTDAQGRKIGITAGHCGETGDAVRSADSYWVGDSGTIVANGTGSDYSVIEFGSNAEITNSYNGTTVTAVGGAVHNGQQICKSGLATGYTCGIVWSADSAITLSQVCAMQGDSGAPVISEGRVVGIISGGMIPNYDLSCRTPLQGVFFMPSMSLNMDRILADIDQTGGPGQGFVPAQ